MFSLALNRVSLEGCAFADLSLTRALLRHTRFTCNLIIPAVQTPQGGFSEMHFTAFARSKKGAEHAAAEKALDFIMSMGLLQAPIRNPPVPFLTPSSGMSDISLEEVLFNMLRRFDVVTSCNALHDGRS